MTATVQDVRNVDLGNALLSVDDARIQCVINDEVPCYFNEAQLGECADLAGALVAAHLITLAHRGTSGPAGPVTSEKAGGLSRSYASTSSTSEGASFWMSTSFGQRYWQIARTRMTTFVTVCTEDPVYGDVY